MAQSSQLTNDVFYTIAVNLFALSLIAERIANLYKLFRDRMRTKTSDKELEKVRERNVMITALVSGWIVAYIAGANLFGLLKGQGLSPMTYGDDGLSWDGYPELNGLQFHFGIFLSGVFISLGSKFWHDMLDIILEFSNLKKAQAGQAQAETQVKENQALATKMNIVAPVLEKINGFSGYDFNPDKSKVVLKFEMDKVPGTPELEKINSIVGKDSYSIVLSDIKLHSGGN
ncbi:MAG: hypothetical protein P0Y49_05075 [Candidatus Pedobacter colombiensis]|uniref:Uncharacterized protein n=1 Tax=Candidatus Pedobacter colombiensis TaxID=3121371 RepID=A0AAJ6B9S5_9SPHI|nr:hypothetical protein [Pedobacter sp.]WEK20508.1 MAG: hypothetical protein P0Y49_05075 [Pedobacter sp.]